MSGHKNQKALETVSVLAFFSLLFGVALGCKALICLALALLFVGIFIKPLARLVSAGWLKFAEAFGKFNTCLILSLVYYVLLTPIAFLYRLTHGDFLNLGKGRGHETTLWVERNHLYEPEDLERMW
jgi:hypothetical protein